MKQKKINGFKLSKRLFAISQLVEGLVVADVGCDHGLLATYLAIKKANLVYACDFRAKPLQKAIKNAEKFKVGRKMRFFLTDGLFKVPSNFDCVVVAGLGGKQIQRIVFSHEFNVSDEVKIILQPQSFLFDLRQKVCEKGFEIEDEVVVFEKGKFYNILVLKYREIFRKISLKEAVLGKVLKRKDEYVLKYLEFEKTKTKNILKGLKCAKKFNLEEIKKYEEIEKILIDVEKQSLFKRV